MTLKTDEVTAVLERLLADKGEGYVYPSANGNCTYSVSTDSGSAPSCIVGWVVDALDPEAFQQIAEFEAAEGESLSARELFDEGIPDTCDREYGEYTRVEIESPVLALALQAAQEVQDSGGTWGNAVLAYNETLEVKPKGMRDPKYSAIMARYRP